MNLLWGSPDFFPVHYDRRRGVLQFVYVSRDLYHQYAFLDQREAALQSARRFEITTEQLRCDSLPTFHNARRPVHYILHTAFCCSTLLARYLECLPRCFVLKEPALLTTIIPDALCLIPYQAWDSQSGSATAPATDSLPCLCLRLLSRSYHGTDDVIIKANDQCTVIAPILLAHDNRSKILLLSIALRSFLVAVLKNSTRRRWIRKRMAFILPLVGLVPSLANIDPIVLNDACAAAYLWLFYRNLFLRLRANNPDRVRLLDGEQLAAGAVVRRRAIAEAVAHLGLKVSEMDIEAAVQSEVSRRHAKNMSMIFDSRIREAEQITEERHLRPELDSAEQWIRHINGTPTVDNDAKISTEC